MVVDDLDVVSIAPTKLEANSPGRVHGHRPLVFAIASELVEADAPQRTEVLQRRCHIEREQQIDRGFEIEASELVWPLAFPHLAGTGLPPRPDHGKNILRRPVSIKKGPKRFSPFTWRVPLRLPSRPIFVTIARGASNSGRAPCAVRTCCCLVSFWWARSPPALRRRRRTSGGRTSSRWCPRCFRCRPTRSSVPDRLVERRRPPPPPRCSRARRSRRPSRRRVFGCRSRRADRPSHAPVVTSVPHWCAILLHRREKIAWRSVMTRLAPRIAIAVAFRGPAIASRAVAEPAPPFVGKWAAQSAQCRLGQEDPGAPMIVRRNGYDQHEAHCTFKSVRPQPPAWAIKAECTVEGNRQDYDFGVQVANNHL